MRDIIIWGAGKIAETLFDYVSADSDMAVRAFCVDAEYRTGDQFCGLPLVSFSDARRQFSPQTHGLLLGIGYHGCNALRQAKFAEGEAAGYQFASYISSRAWTAPSARIGRGCVILDHVSLEPHARLGDNTMLWSGVTIGHHAQVGRHAWLAAGSTIGGGARIGDGCFLGLNATVGHEVELGSRCLLGGAVLVSKSAAAGSVFVAPDATPYRLDVDRFLQLSGKL